MDIVRLLLNEDMTAFTLALLLVAGLLVVELLLSFVGGSLLGGDAELDAEIEPELGVAADGDIDLDGEAPATGTEPSAMLSWLGIGKVPLTIWIAAVLTGFGLAGYVLQLASETVFGGTIPAVLAVPLAIVPGLAFGARFARTFARLVPRHESYHVSRRSFGGRRGVIVQGTARRGRPAQAKIRDGYGETHYLQVEPERDGDALSQGEEIVVLRAADGRYRALRLGDAPGALAEGE